MDSHASSSSKAGGRIVQLGGGQPEITTPRILMPQDVFQRIAAYVDYFPKEISGIGRVQQVGPLQFLIESAFLVRQEINEAAFVDISTGFVEFAEAKAAADESTVDYRFWWHSHVNFPVEWSREDLATIRKLFDDRWLIALVMNRRREFRVRFECFSPLHIVFDNLPLELILRDSPSIREVVEADIKANVVARPTSPPASAKGGKGIVRRVQEFFGGSEGSDAIVLDAEGAGAETPGPNAATPPTSSATTGDAPGASWPEGWTPPSSQAQPATAGAVRTPAATEVPPKSEQEADTHG